ncbi:MAG: PAS domain-containing protein, partial [Methanophagales archaeon]|nr:PAS domain-containing protein [Methanophagales archaeon]
KLPDVDGTALLCEFKKNHPDMVCMIITGHASVQNAIKALEDGANGYFVKPIIIEDIVHRVEETLDKQRLVCEKRRVDVKLAEERDYARHLIESSPDFQVALDKDGRIMDVNETFEKIISKSREDIIGVSIYEYLPEEETEKAIAEIFEKGKVRNIELTADIPGKEALLCNFSGTVFTTPEEELGIYVTGRDITEQRRAEDQLKASLKEKEVLLQEIHHRVKNSLQVVSSLLNMQARAAKDKDVKDILSESRNRINTMALIHSQLYESENLSEINMKGFMDKLLVQLLQIHSVPDRKITPVFHALDCSLPISIAVPVGLIANEFLTNAFKHAFVNRKEGRIEVCLSASEKGAVNLTVSDDGIGLPEGFDINASKTLGLHVVKVLVEDQLGGNLAVIRDKGTTFKVEFEIAKE